MAMTEMADATSDLRDFLTIEAMDDIDNGNFVEHEDVRASTSAPFAARSTQDSCAPL